MPTSPDNSKELLNRFMAENPEELSLKEQVERLEQEKREPQEIKAQTPDNKELVFDLEKARQDFQDWYKEHNLDIEEIPEISLNKEEIEEVKTLIEQGLINDIAIRADKVKYADLNKETAKGYNQTWQSSNFQSDGGFDKLDEQETNPYLEANPEEDKPAFHLVFYNNIKELDQDDVLKETLGKSADDLKPWLENINKKHKVNLEGISLKDYLIIQRKYTEQALEQAKQANPNIDIKDKSLDMDAKKWTWCAK